MTLGIEYYGFALFVALLVCMVAVLCKYLFADVKRQNKLLDEKESKLLKLYQSIEDVLDEFSDQAEEARADIERLTREARASQAEVMRAQAAVTEAAEAASEAAAETARVKETKSRQSSAKSKTSEQKAQSAAADAPAKKKTTKSSAKAEGGVSFQKIIDEMESDAAEPEVINAKVGKNETILALKAEGKSVQKIAQELGITQNEVKLVIGLNQ